MQVTGGSFIDDGVKFADYVFDPEYLIHEEEGYTFGLARRLWCAPCRPQSRALQQFIADHPAWDIDLVLVSWDELAAGQADG